MTAFAQSNRQFVGWGREISWRTLPELIRTLAKERGDRHATEIDGRRLTYGELDSVSDSIAAALAELDIGKGDRVASLLFNSAEAVLLWLGAAKIGAVWTPLNVGLVGNDLAYAISDCEARLIVVDPDNAAKLDHDAVRSQLPDLRYATREPRDGFRPFDELLAGGGEPSRSTVFASDAALIIYSGGTTGMPKGVVLPHFACVAAGLRTVEALELTADDHYFAIGQLFHVGGLFCAFLGPLIAGSASTIDRRFSLSNYWRRVRETSATVIDPIGVVLTLLCQQPFSEQDRNHRVRIALGVTAGTPEHIPAEFSRRFGIPLLNLYSLTEAGGAMIVHNVIGSTRPEAHGKAWGWAEIAILDDEDRPLPQGTIGEIALRPNYPFIFMTGYFNDPKRTLETTANLWLHTGDLGHLDEDGFLHFRGRQAHWLRRRGENISAYEVEETLSAFPGVAEVAVVGVPSELGDEEVKAFIVPEPFASIDFVELCFWAAERMAPFKTPRFVELVEALPRSAAKNEVERHKLKARTNDRAWDREAVLGRSLERPKW